MTQSLNCIKNDSAIELQKLIDIKTLKHIIYFTNQLLTSKSFHKKMNSML